jgi:hypothetical protein
MPYKDPVTRRAKDAARRRAARLALSRGVAGSASPVRPVIDGVKTTREGSAESLLDLLESVFRRVNDVDPRTTDELPLARFQLEKARTLAMLTGAAFGAHHVQLLRQRLNDLETVLALSQGAGEPDETDQ